MVNNVDTSIDLVTGRVKRLQKSVWINKAVVPPTTMSRLVQGSNPVFNNSDVRQDERYVLIDSRDLPRDFLVNLNTLVEIDNERWQTVRALDHKYVYELTIKKIDESKLGC